VWVVAPLLVADCISREKREGTLGLLFLTPLTAGSIVAGKSLTQGLRALTIFWSVLPVLSFPFLLGGITWRDAALAFLLNLGALISAISAGILASSLCTEWIRALILAVLISAFLSVVFVIGHYVGFLWMLDHQQFGGSKIDTYFSLRQLQGDTFARGVGQLFVFSTDPGSETFILLKGPIPGRFSGALRLTWETVWTTSPPPVRRGWFMLAGGLVASSLFFLFLVMNVAAWRLRRSWKDEPPSVRTQRIARVMTQPIIARRYLRLLSRRALDRNPIGWLHQHSLSARMMQWGWCLGLILFECALVTDQRMASLWTGQYWLAYGLLFSMAFSAAGSFRTERQSGAMELLLVTPLQEIKIVIGRLGGIWSQFLPAILILAAAWLQLSQNARLFAGIASSRLDAWSQIVFPVIFVTSFFTLPLIGLYFSLVQMNFLMAWLLTIVTGLMLPVPLYWFGISRWPVESIVFRMCLFQLILAFVAGYFLHRTLKARTFVLHS
jgi:ABC-type transport system involved in multi-copper enzyme maturation permease subunit